MTSIVPTLFMIAALCLLPAWLAGCLALGGAIGVWLYDRRQRQRSRELSSESTAIKLPENVVRLERKKRSWT